MKDSDVRRDVRVLRIRIEQLESNLEVLSKENRLQAEVLRKLQEKYPVN